MKMLRQVITDVIWNELEATLRKYGCHRRKNDRNIMEAILWKLRTGAPWRDVPQEFCPWKTAYNRFNRWSSKGLWNNFFLSYEAKLIRNGYSRTEATSALISMQVELGVVKSEPLDVPVEDLLANSIYAPMRMEIRSILKSLGVKSMTVKLRRS
jgi:transposase